MLFRSTAAVVFSAAALLSVAPQAQPSRGQLPQADPLVTRYRVEAPTVHEEHAFVVLNQQLRDTQAKVRLLTYILAVAEAERKAAEAAAPPAPKPTVRRVSQPQAGGDQGGRHYSCPQYASSDNPSGDFAVPCYIIGRESHGSYTADNPNSSAYGAYQIMHLPPGTSPAEQDRIARGMALCNWEPPNYCKG